MIAVPFIGLGSYMIYWGLLEIIQRKGPATPALIATSMASVFFILGVLLLLFREGVTLDRSQGTAAQWRRVFKHSTLATHWISEFNTVQVVTIQGRRTSISVRLVGNSKKLILYETTNQETARRIANEAAEYLSIPIEKTQ